MSSLPITPETKVGELLDHYPQLEDLLIQLAPAFKKLRNPVLRRTVARVATLANAAQVGGVPPRELVATLREAAGQKALEHEDGTTDASTQHPWIVDCAVTERVDADALLAQGQSPLEAVNGRLASLPQGSALCVTSSFVPAPLIDVVTARGFACHHRQLNGRIHTLIAHARG